MLVCSRYSEYMLRNRLLPDATRSKTTAKQRITGDETIHRRSFLRKTGGALAASGVLASAAGQPVSAGTDDDEVDVIDIEYDDLDTPSDAYDLFLGEAPDSYSFVEDPSASGETAMALEFAQGVAHAGNACYNFPEEGYGQPSEVHSSCRVRMQEGWTQPAHDTVRFWWTGLNLDSGPCGSGQNCMPNGANGWSTRVGWTDRDGTPGNSYRLFVYTYHMDQAQANVGDLELTETFVEPGEWFEFESYVRMNTYDDGGANNDGVVRITIDDEVAYERENFRFSANGDQAIEYVGAGGYYWGAQHAPTTQSLYFDDHTLTVNGSADDLE